MNLKTIAVFAALLSLGLSAQAQSFSLREAGANVQINGFQQNAFTQAEILERIPNSTLLQQGFDQRLGSGPYSDAVGSLWLGFHKNTGESKHGQVLRIGVIIGTSYFSFGNFENKNTLRADTLISSSNVAYLDSVDRQITSISHRSEQLGLQAQYLFYYNTQSRWSLYGGIGVGVSGHFSGSYELHTYSDFFEQITMNNQVYSGRSRYNFDHEVEKHSTGAGVSGFVSIPIGLNFRIGRNPNNFWGSTHLFWEVQPNITYHAIDNDYPSLLNGLFQNFGFRVTW